MSLTSKITVARRQPPYASLQQEEILMTKHHPNATLEPIPQPPGKFFLGNLQDVAGPAPLLELMELAREYGPIYQLTFQADQHLLLSQAFSWPTNSVTKAALISL